MSNRVMNKSKYFKKVGLVFVDLFELLSWLKKNSSIV